MEIKGEQQPRGLSLDRDPKKLLLTAILFIVFFVVPVGVHRFYLFAEEDKLVDEVYTETAIRQQNQEAEILNQGEVAGIDTNRQLPPGQYIQVPFTDSYVSADFTTPQGLLLLVGVAAMIVSLLLLLKFLFNF